MPKLFCICEVFSISIVLDISLILLIIVPIVLGCKRGFIRSISRIASFVLAIAVSIIFTSYILTYIDNSSFKKSIKEKVSLNVLEYSSDDETAQKDVEDSKSELSKYIGHFGIDTDKIKKDIAGGVNGVIDSISDSISGYIADKLTYYACFAALFAATYIIAVIIFWIIGKFVEFPVLKHCDKLLGCLLGIITSFLLVLVFMSVTKAAMPLLTKVDDSYTDSSSFEENTLVYKYVSEVIPTFTSTN